MLREEEKQKENRNFRYNTIVQHILSQMNTRCRRHDRVGMESQSLSNMRGGMTLHGTFCDHGGNILQMQDAAVIVLEIVAHCEARQKKKQRCASSVTQAFVI